MTPGRDILAATSGFDLISSGMPPGPDVGDTPTERGKVTRLGHSMFVRFSE
jgi:hypothetical protein